MASIFQQLLIDQMDQRGWSQADLCRASGGAISRQTISLWTRQELRRMPSERSIVALADAFSIHADVIRRAAAASTGVPVAQVAIPSALDLADVPPDVLVIELGRRLGASATSIAHAGTLAAYRPSPGRRTKPH